MIAWLQHVLNSADLPAWLQAFAAIVALGISVWATRQATASERKKDRLKVRSIAVAIYPELLKLSVVIENIKGGIERLRENNRVLIQSAAANLMYCELSLPPMIERNVDNLFLLGEPAGATCLQLIGLISQYNELVEAISNRMMLLDAEQWKEAMDHLKNHLALLTDVVAKSQVALRPLHGLVKV
jgi:hypothetical protein